MCIGINEEDVREFLVDDEIDFLNYMKRFCDVRKISTSLLKKKVLRRGDAEQISKATTPEDAADVLYHLLYGEASTRKLEATSAALKEDQTNDSHLILAQKIDTFFKKGTPKQVEFQFTCM